MIHDNAQVGAPQTLYKDTKANIEAIGSPVAGMIAFATDTPRQMVYTGSAWKLGLLSDFDNDGFYWDSGNARIGVGISTPASSLDIYGQIRSSRTTTSYLLLQDTAESQAKIEKYNNSGAIVIDINPMPGDGTSAAGFRFFRNTNTTGGKNIDIFLGDGSSTVSVRIDADASNLLLGTTTDGMTSGGSIAISQDLAHRGTKAGFMNTAPITKPTVSGSRGGNAALASLLTALANYGLITNSTSA